MEQEKVNIAALLKDAPRGTRLYSPVCGECKLSNPCNDDSFIEVLDIDNDIHEFFNDGRFYREGEPALFPSKEVQDWGCFKAKYVKPSAKSSVVSKLLRSNGDIDICHFYYTVGNCLYYIDSINRHIKMVDKYVESERYDYILSTGTELKLEEEEQPKFKVGDAVRFQAEPTKGVIIKIRGNEIDISDTLDTQRSAWAPKYFVHHLTPEEITKWNKEVLEPNHRHYSTSKRKIIHWFLPFDKVVVRHFDFSYWHCNLFSDWDTDNVEEHYICIDDEYKHCLPYNDKTAKLIGTKDDYEEE